MIPPPQTNEYQRILVGLQLPSKEWEFLLTLTPLIAVTKSSIGPKRSLVCFLITPRRILAMFFNIVNNHWNTRAPIRVFRTGPYFILECQHINDRDAILHFNTIFIDGKPITFRPCSAHRIPTSINFNMGRLWVRIHDLPWGFLNTDWTVRILSHVGFIESIEHHGHGLPQQPYLRAKLIIDLSQPLIPGCFVPIEGNRLSWVYFRYEGIFKFCKECGCVGHNTGRCQLSAYDAAMLIQRRVRGFEDDGMTVLQTQSGIPLYTNFIRGLTDRFLNRNARLNLASIPPYQAGPQFDPYLYPNLYLHDHGESDSSSEDYFDATPDFQQPRLNPHHQYYSDENSQNHTNPPPDFSNASFYDRSPIRWEENVTPSPGRRFGLDLGSSMFVDMPPESSAEHRANPPLIDLNLPPGSPTAVHMVPSSHEMQAGQTNNHSSSLFQQLGLSSWVSRTTWLPHNWCGSVSVHEHTTPPAPSTQLNIPNPNTLEALVQEGWRVVPPGPDESGPSNWQERILSQASHGRSQAAKGVGYHRSMRMMIP